MPFISLFDPTTTGRMSLEYLQPRFVTRSIKVGDLEIGGSAPIVVQSMTTSDTMNIDATVQQIKDLANVGCQLARVTAPTVQDAEALRDIRDRLRSNGYSIPLVADIHFVPAAAMIAAEYVEKVRINPGNYADRKMFKVRDYSDSQYREELDRIHEKFKPLVLKLKDLGRALRIGTNHGSLSDRIMNRFGDSPEGMVESAFEFAEICRTYDFHNFCFSMKASNVGVMVKAYRLLVQRQIEKSWNYPLHLGVTEAGDGEDGRLKSAIGIGTLLSEGIGDTIRVSLTEAAVKEIPVAKAIAEKYAKESKKFFVSGFDLDQSQNARDFQGLPEVWWKLNNFESLKAECATTQMRPDVLFVDPSVEDLNEVHNLKLRLKSISGFSEGLKIAFRVRSSWFEDERLKRRVLAVADLLVADEQHLEIDKPVVRLITSVEMLKSERVNPQSSVLYWKSIGTGMDRVIEASRNLGAPFVDQNWRGIFVDGADIESSLTLAYGVLQATRRRMSKTEYISCPSCGRTLFDLEETTAQIKGVTSHLRGVKIAVMGCIVNGPGEMADADFGYVGGAPGRVNLYVGKDCVERNIPSLEAPGRLVNLIKANGRWAEPV